MHIEHIPHAEVAGECMPVSIDVGIGACDCMVRHGNSMCQGWSVVVGTHACTHTDTLTHTHTHTHTPSFLPFYSLSVEDVGRDLEKDTITRWQTRDGG